MSKRTRPVSDLAKYEETLKDVSIGNPLFLIEGGKERYVVMTIDDYEMRKALNRLHNELASGEKSGRDKGWVGLQEAKKRLGLDE